MQYYLRLPVNGIPTYPTAAGFPISAPNGAQAIALDTDILYIFNTTSMTWIPVASPAAVAVLSGDVTGTDATTIVSYIQGNPVGGTTGTGNVVFSNSPTLTGTATFATISATTINSTTVTSSSLSANEAVFTNSSKNLVSNPITGTGNVVMSASPTITGVLTVPTIAATSSDLTLSGSTGNVNVSNNILTDVQSITFNSGDVIANDGSGSLWYGESASANGSGIAVGRSSSGTDGGIGIGYEANGQYSGTAVGYMATTYDAGAAVGYGSNGSFLGVALGYQANGGAGAAIGYQTDGTYSGTALGLSAIGRVNGVAVGTSANGSNSGVAVGYQSVGSGNSVAVGYGATANTGATAVGYGAGANNSGVAIGENATVTNSGVAVGYNTNGYDYSVAVGYGAYTQVQSCAVGTNSQAQNYAIAIGSVSNANGLGSVAIGANDGSGPNATVPSGWTDTVELGRGAATLEGALNFRSIPVMDSTGALYSSATKTTYSGSSSGTAIWSMPFRGSSYKKFFINLQTLFDAGGTITFPTAFTATPYVYGDSGAVAIAVASTTTLTLAPSSGITGNIFVEGY